MNFVIWFLVKLFIYSETPQKIFAPGPTYSGRVAPVYIFTLSLHMPTFSLRISLLQSVSE